MSHKHEWRYVGPSWPSLLSSCPLYRCDGCKSEGNPFAIPEDHRGTVLSLEASHATLPPLPGEGISGS